MTLTTVEGDYREGTVSLDSRPVGIRQARVLVTFVADSVQPKGRRRLRLAPADAIVQDLARQQGVEPLTEPSLLAGTWPGNDDDGFEQMICQRRQAGGLAGIRD